MTTGTRASDAAQAASGVVAGLVAPHVLGPEALLWVIAALGICSLADVAAPPSKGRLQLAVRYLASVAVTLAASWVAASAVAMYHPEWRHELWAVRIAAALAAGLLLHPLIAASPRLLAELWAAVLDRVRGQTTQRSKPSD